ncbi:MAG: UDP-N-acetylglucosamine--N-acetylmuramyl-(pentapeptide) pyrophosphoryl-undecaprenol N-acetylglucosamine transferase, partial [Cyanobacteria bacterium J06639_1]
MQASVVRREADLTGEELSVIGLEWLHNPDKLQAMRQQLGTLAASQAGSHMAALVRDIIAPVSSKTSVS